MGTMIDGVSKLWLLRPTSTGGIEVHGVSGPYEAAWYSAVWQQGYSSESEKNLRLAIDELERAIAALKERVVEDYDLEAYD